MTGGSRSLLLFLLVVFVTVPLFVFAFARLDDEVGAFLLWHLAVTAFRLAHWEGVFGGFETFRGQEVRPWEWQARRGTRISQREGDL